MRSLAMIMACGLLVSASCLLGRVGAQSTLPQRDHAPTRCDDEASSVVIIPLLENMLSSLDHLQRRMDTTEADNREMKATLSAMKQTREADSRRLAGIESESQRTASSLRELATVVSQPAPTQMAGHSDTHLKIASILNITDAQHVTAQDIKALLTGIATSVDSRKAFDRDLHSSLVNFAQQLRNIIESAVRNKLGESQLINATVDNMLISLRELKTKTGNTEAEITSKLEQIAHSNSIVNANVNNLLTLMKASGNASLARSSQVSSDLVALRQGVSKYLAATRNTSTDIDEITAIVRDDVERQKQLVLMIQNSSSTQRSSDEEILGEIDKLQASNRALLEASRSSQQVEKTIQTLVSRLDERSRNTSSWQLVQALGRVSTTLAGYKGDMTRVDVKIQQLISKGNEQLTALSNLAHQMTHVKEHVQSAHDNVTSLLENLSAATTNISSLVSPRPISRLGTQASPVQSCADLTGKPSGLYWIDPDGDRPTRPFTVYCDMETDGGGWTLVYTYKFRNYRSFGSGSNAVTPRPTWPLTWASNQVPTSSSVPQSETDYGAVNFSLWKEIGSEFLVKSNIANWIKCSENGGSLVRARAGSLNCNVVKRLVTSCPAAIPDNLKWDAVGPYIKNSGGQIYFWDGSTSSIYPTHDPCGRTSSSTKFPSISNPHGNIYLR